MPNSLSLQSALVVAVVAAFALQWWLTRRAVAGFWMIAWSARFAASLLALRVITSPASSRVASALVLGGIGIGLMVYRAAMLLAVVRTGRPLPGRTPSWITGLLLAVVLFASPPLLQLVTPPSAQLVAGAFILFRIAPLLMLWQLLQTIRASDGWPDAPSRRFYVITLGYGMVVIPIGVVHGLFVFGTAQPLTVPTWLVTLQMIWTAGDAAAGLRSVFALDHAERQWRAEIGERGTHLRALGQTTSGVAHDLNNVLAAVVLVRDGWHAAAAADRLGDLAIARSATARGLAIISSLSQFDAPPTRPAAIDLAEVLSRLAPSLTPLLAANHSLRLDLPLDRVPVLADQVSLERVIQNLVKNSRDAMTGSGEVLLQVRTVAAPQGREAVVRVRDTGCGIPAESLARVIDPFFTTKAPGQGSGLGLAMAHSFAVEAGGHLELQSTEGVGTTVELFLPVLPSSAAVEVTA